MPAMAPWTPARTAPMAVYDAELGQPKNVGYVQLSGAAGDYISCPDANALDITGDIEIVARVMLADWSPSTPATIVAKEQTTSQRSYRMQVTASGFLSFSFSLDGSASIGLTGSVAVPVVDGQTCWVRSTREASNGRIRFFWAPDQVVEPSSWTQLGIDANSTSGALFVSTSQLEIGGRIGASTELLNGKVHRVIVRNGIGGTTVADFDASKCYGDGYTDQYGNPWTLSIPKIYDTSGTNKPPATFGAGSNQPLWLPWQGRPQVYSPAGTNNTVSAPSLAQHDITGDIEIVARVMQVPNGAAMRVVSRTTANTWGLFVNASNLIGASVKIGGVHYYPSVPFGQWFGRPVWVRWTRVAATGENAFYVHPDQAAEPTNWMLLGTSTTGGAGAMDSVAGLGVIVGGYATTGGEPWQGTISKVTVRNGIGGAVAADFDAGLCGQSGYSSPDGSVWTVNRATSGRKIVVQSPAANSARSIILLGTDDGIDIPAVAYPSMGVSDNFTIGGVVRQYATPPSFGTYFSRKIVNDGNTAQGIAMFSNGTALQVGANFGDGTTGVTWAGSVFSAGTRLVIGIALTARTAGQLFVNNVATPITGGTIGAVGSASLGTAGAIGKRSSVASGYQDCEVSAMWTFDRALSAAEYGLLTAYYGGGA